MKAGRDFGPWDNRPRITPRLRWIWEAFADLQTCRPVGMGMAPIPWTAIREYALANGIVEIERFEYMIRVLDTEYLAQHRDKEE